MTAPKDIPGASAAASSQQDTNFNSRDASSSSSMTAAKTTATTTTGTGTRSRSSTFSYPRWDANGNSHHPPPDYQSVSVSSPRSPASINTSITGMSPSSSSILTLLGLSPKSAGGPLPLPSVHEGQGQGQGQGHRRGFSVGARVNAPSSHDKAGNTSFSSTSSSSPFYDDDDDDDDGPSEAVTPPQQQLALGLTSMTEGGNNNDSNEKKKKQGQQQLHKKPTDFGNELGGVGGARLSAARGREDQDELDDVAGLARSQPGAGAGAGAGPDLYGASLGRRASWSPRPTPNQNNAITSGSPPTGASILSWLHGQQASSASASSSSSSNATQATATSGPAVAAAAAAAGGAGFGRNNGSTTNPIAIKQPPSTQIETSSASYNNATAPADNSYKDFGSSPVGLFRRLSLSVNRRPPPPPAPPSTVSGMSDATDQDNARIGRPLGRVTSAPPRRLSPMGERMLRSHYDAFA